MSNSATRRFQFCAGHRVLGHGSKCRHLHGHNYVALVTVTADRLNSLGMVVDFSVIKDVIGEWIDKHWDHGFIMHVDDHAARSGLLAFEGAEVRRSPNETPDFSQKVFELPANPTAENMASYLFHICEWHLKEHGVQPVKVVLWETENCSATALDCGVFR